MIPAVVYYRLLEKDVRKKKRLGKRKTPQKDVEEIEHQIKIAKVRDEIVVLALLGRDDAKVMEFPPATDEEENK